VKRVSPCTKRADKWLSQTTETNTKYVGHIFVSRRGHNFCQPLTAECLGVFSF